MYARISKDPTATKLGVRRQEADCRALAERKGWTVSDVYVDNDLSASTGRDRPEFQRLLGDIKTGAVDAVVVWDLDRLVRRPIELEHFFASCDAAGLTQLATVGGDVDLATGEGVMVARIKGAVAAEEVRKMSRRLQRKHLELAEAGRLSGGGSRPFGYEADRVTLRPSEAALVQEAAARVLAGESVLSVAQEWNERGVRTVSGVPWRRATLRTVLTSGRVSGRREHKGEIVGEAVWPAIIDPADSDRLRARIITPRTGPAQRPRRFLLSGLLRCGACGAKLAGRPHRSGLHRFRCDDGTNGCGKVGVATAPLERYVRAAVVKALDEPRTARAVRRHTGEAADRSVDQALREIATDEAKLVELGEMWDAGEITRPEWQRLRAKVEARLEDARRRAAAAQDDAAIVWLGRGGVLDAQWDDVTLHRKQAIVRSLVDRIVVAPLERRTGRFDPGRIDIQWRI